MQLLRYDEAASGRLRVRVIRKNYYIINYRVASLLKNILAENLTWTLYACLVQNQNYDLLKIKNEKQICLWGFRWLKSIIYSIIFVSQSVHYAKVLVIRFYGFRDVCLKFTVYISIEI